MAVGAAQVSSPTDWQTVEPNDWQTVQSAQQLSPKVQQMLTANPKGEGTYAVETPYGSTLQVPYSQVPVATGLQGWKLSGGDQARYAKDTAADPNHPSYWQALTNPVGSGAHAQSVVGDVEQAGGRAIADLASMVRHPINTVEGMGQLAAETSGLDALEGESGPVQNRAKEFGQEWRQDPGLAVANAAGDAAAMAEGGRAAGALTSGVEPSTALPDSVNRLIPEAVRNGTLPSGWDWVANKARDLVAGDVNAPIAGGEGLTPAARYESMKAMGMQPNAAEATNSPLLKGTQWLNEDSLTAAGQYADARAANIKALNDYVEDVLNKMSPYGSEEGGAAVQQGLRAAQEKLQNQAAQGYLNLDKQVGSRKLPGWGLQQTAKVLYDQNADYYAQHPELVPTNAWKIVKDLAGADTEPPFQARNMSFSELHQLRSDLLEIVRTNPDIVKNQAGGWLQTLANAADDTMVNGGKGMTPAQLKIYRDANEAWANMKNTYDNPQSQIYHAVRSGSPSTLVNGIQQTPEMAKVLQQALGPEGMGPIQRGVAEKALGSTKEGGYNFRTFQGKFNKLPEAYRNALFTPEQLQQLDDIGNAGTLLHEDVNPSGSAKQGQRIAEGAEFLNSAGHAVMGSPEQLGLNVAYHAGQYGLGKLMHSPSFVDWLMRGRGFAPVEDAPITLGPSRRGSVMGGDPDSILHDVQRSGKKIGVLEAGIQGKNADVRWLGDDKLGNKLSGRLGPQGLSQLAREIVRLHPQVENISGIRSGGAMGDDLRAVNFPAPSASRELPSPSHRLIPAAVATGAMSSGWDWENNRPKD